MGRPRRYFEHSFAEADPKPELRKVERITLGQRVERYPVFGQDGGATREKPLQGTVCYILPRGRYYEVAFILSSGDTVRESWLMR